MVPLLVPGLWKRRGKGGHTSLAGPWRTVEKHVWQLHRSATSANRRAGQQLTLVDRSAFRRTLTVFSWLDTSSIVFGRLHGEIAFPTALLWQLTIFPPKVASAGPAAPPLASEQMLPCYRGSCRVICVKGTDIRTPGHARRVQRLVMSDEPSFT